MERGTIMHLANLLRSCTREKSHLSGKTLHGRIIRTGLFSHTYLCNRIIDLYISCNNETYVNRVFDEMPVKDVYTWNAALSFRLKIGNFEEAYELFDLMPERNAFSWNNVISALVRSGCEEKALNLYHKMVTEGFLPTRFTLASVLRTCNVLLDYECTRRCHGLGVKVGLDKNVFVSNALLSVYAAFGLVSDALRVFEDLPEPNEVSFTAMINGLAKKGRVLEAFQMFRLMCERGFQIDSVCLSSVLGVCAGLGVYHGQSEMSDTICGQLIHGLALKLGFERDLHLNNCLLDMYVQNGDMDGAELVFANMPELNVVSWNIIISGYGQKHQIKKVEEYLKRMSLHGFEPNEVTYVNFLGACIRSGDIGTSYRIFSSMACPSVSLWNVMLSGYSQYENHEEAMMLFRKMQFQNVKPDRTTLAAILISSTRMGFLKAGKQVHAVSLKSVLHTDTYVASALIDLYSKCGKKETAEKIFYHMPELDTVCWNSMLAGLSINSLDKEAFMLFNQIRHDGLFPTEASYATALTCCAKLSSLLQGGQVHGQIVKDGFLNDVFVGSALINMYCKCGNVDGARQVFENLPGKNTIIWNEMIHGYAQSGRGDEAVCMSRDMISSGNEPDSVTFVSVLTACSHSGFVDEGVEIFNSMQKEHGIEPEVDHYICLVDCLGRAGRFHEVEVLLENMPYKNNATIWEVLLSACRVHANVCLAKRAGEELFRLDAQNPAPYVLLANMYASLGLWDKANAIRGLMTENCVPKGQGCSWIEGYNDRMMDITVNHAPWRVSSEASVANG